MLFNNYDPEKFYDEYFSNNKVARTHVQAVVDAFNDLSFPAVKKLKNSIDITLRQIGITFNVAGHKEGVEKIFPFDIIPRILSSQEWKQLEAGLTQRITAMDMFVADVYDKRNIVRDGIVPEELILTSKNYLPLCRQVKPAQNRWIHISGIDVVRDDNGEFYVLEDNFRCPSGVSYVLENRALMKQALPSFFRRLNVRPVMDYPEKLLDTLHSMTDYTDQPNIVLLTPGVYNSAYFEHAYLARQMGIQLVEGRDMIVKDDFVYLKTTRGLEKIDVIYRRIDDEYLDPLVLRKDSVLGVPGLIQSYIKGHVTIANAPGTGIADDKAVYSYVPKIIEYYLSEKPIINNVPTYLMDNPEHQQYALSNMDSMVVKPTNASGGYGIYVGPHENEEVRNEITRLIQSNPRNYIAQPKLLLSRIPTLCGDHAEGRHVDFRPYILYGKEVNIIPGGLTRVALNKNSLIVNSSQGGGSKDTWVLEG